jgi:hypothetical protein
MQHSAGAAAQGQKKKGKRKAVTLAEEHNTVHLIPSNAANRAAKRARTDADEVAPAGKCQHPDPHVRVWMLVCACACVVRVCVCVCVCAVVCSVGEAEGA